MHTHVALCDIEAALEWIKESPQDDGVVKHIVCRPRVGERKVLNTGQLDIEEGLIGDNWNQRVSSRSQDGKPHPDTQLNLMNARVIEVLALEKGRWQLAGDQFFVDFDLTPENVPPGTRLAIGSAVIEITNEPHLGCKKFAERFGIDAVKFVNTDIGKSLNLRGVNARVIYPGSVSVGTSIKKV